ncbi:hypothetical protein NDU88_004568 [Pleurodeles waltl]|uniref:Uncharacterized protein n=1 Tax=Pleurodeles waltl TaxID=8319 RepID=A0AAV7V5J8_PLEWA|nr:hypothetical protein NDU88_004568 [Pleurodeles waltl]
MTDHGRRLNPSQAAWRPKVAETPLPQRSSICHCPSEVMGAASLAAASAHPLCLGLRLGRTSLSRQKPSAAPPCLFSPEGPQGSPLCEPQLLLLWPEREANTQGRAGRANTCEGGSLNEDMA